ncbi:aerobic respiration two-component sensor histidine kinase ArcB [Salmonella enterica]
MKQIRMLAQYYVDLMMKLGLVRFSMLLALALVVLAIVVQMAVTMVLHGQVESIDVIRSIFFGLLITPWAVYFLSVVVEQLEESRQRLSRLVQKLEEMRERDLKLNVQLKDNIAQLNQEIADREKAEAELQETFEQLKVEIKEREEAQIQLEQQSSFLRSFLDASPDLVFYRNEDKEFSGCNRAMELLTGKSEKQLVHLKPEDVYSPEAAEKVIETDEKVFRHNVSLTYEQWLDYPDGRKACFEIRKVPYYDRVGKRHGLMGFGRDITERKRYQDALERASRDKTTFISTISHELRTPLNGIVGLSRILLDTDLTAEQEKYLKTIHVSAVTLGNIFNDIIDMDKMERRKVQLDLDNQPVDFTSFMADLENLSGLQAQQKGLRFVLEPTLPLPHKVITDGTRLRQILWNLISNAVKFTQQGQVTVRARYDEGDMLHFEVEDSGIGIPQDEQDKIFAMYYQVKDSHGGKPATGTGIGLAVSRRLAKNMGGDITVSSLPGKGSTFTLTVHAPAVAEEVEDAFDEDDMPLPALHVLLVEDIELNVIVARSVLEKLGNSVDVAMTGKAALEMFAPGEYDLVLLDIQLPDMTGLDIARELTRRHTREDLPPLVALTANVLKDKKEYLDAGMDDVLSKPLSVPALTAMIKKFWDATDKEESTVTPEESDKAQALLDIPMLEQYIELVGPKLITDGLAVFEKMMPGYLSVLESNLTARDKKGVVEEGHKIKGAAGSVGLRHLQQLGQQIQSPDLPAWEDNVAEWIEEMKQEWQHDVAVLKAWVANAEKK